MQPTLKTPPLQSAWPAMPNGGAGVETEERVPRRLRGAGDRKDIFALVKGNHRFLCGQNPFWVQLKTFGTV